MIRTVVFSVIRPWLRNGFVRLAAQ